MSDYAAAMSALRDARDALNAMDIAVAAAALARHDAALREALTADPPRLARSEGEALALAHRQLLDDLQAVHQGVSAGLSESRRSGNAVRAYLGARDA